MKDAIILINNVPKSISEINLDIKDNKYKVSILINEIDKLYIYSAGLIREKIYNMLKSHIDTISSSKTFEELYTIIINSEFYKSTNMLNILINYNSIESHTKIYLTVLLNDLYKYLIKITNCYNSFKDTEKEIRNCLKVIEKYCIENIYNIYEICDRMIK